MNMCFIPLSKYSFEITCGGMQGICHVYDMKFTFKNGYIDFSHGTNILQQSNNCLRRRNFSLSSQHSSEDIEENIEEVNEKIKEDLNKKTSLSKSDNHNQQGDDIKKDNNIPDYQFDFELKNSFQTDFHLNEPYQKLIKYSARNNMVFSGGADGWIRFWTLPNYNLFKEIKAHDNEIDDIDIHPNGKHLVSVSRDCKCYIWNVSTGKLLTTLNHDQVIPRPSNNKQKLPNQAEPKYNPRLCRYSIVEGDENNSRLFVTLNTQSKLDSYICKWFIKNDQYLIEKIVATGDVPIFAMAIRYGNFFPFNHFIFHFIQFSNDGRFLAIGKQTGDVDVYIAFSLQRCYHFVQAHNIFVTGIEFLSTSPATLELVGGNTEISLVSISVDNRIVLHKIPRRGND